MGNIPYSEDNIDYKLTERLWIFFMKILIKSVYLFLFGVYVELCKKRFDAIMDRTIQNGGDISATALTKRSNRCYELYSRFLDYENSLRYDMARKKYGY